METCKKMNEADLIVTSIESEEKFLVEEELRESELKYKTLYQSSRDAIMMLTPEEGFFSGNPATVEIFACKDEKEFTSHNPADLSPEYQPDGKLSAVKAKDMMEIAMKDGSHFFEWTHRRINGEEFFATVLLTRMEIKGRKCLQATVRDITESKKIEREIKKLNEELEDRVIDRTIQLAVINSELRSNIEERKKIEKELLEARNMAETASRAKSDFIASMSHELRTPLNSILGYAQLFLKDEKLSAEYKRGINIILKSGNHLLGLINDVLDMVKIEAKEIELHEKNFSLYDMLEFIENIMEVNRNKKDLLFFYDYSSRLPEHIFGDEKRLTQILINLFSNSVKFTEKGHVRLKVDKHEGKIHFSVEDTGSGIAEDRLKDIFQPFKQINPILKKAEGTGLGLPISKKLVSLMGGELYVESIYGKGSRFWFSLELPELSSEKELLHNVADKEYKWDKRRISDRDDKEEYMVIPPSEILESLYSFIRKGNIKNFKKELAKVNISDNKYEVFYRRLKDLSDNFEIERLLNLLEISMGK
jgi:PAS domain S-box-containing protein